ncbi:SBBP repeat-containing protein [candidate division KSB1 bacterium]|nr:SBBP repeat-containing protein [candidate division KSB1 bacterium]
MKGASEMKTHGLFALIILLCLTATNAQYKSTLRKQNRTPFLSEENPIRYHYPMRHFENKNHLPIRKVRDVFSERVDEDMSAWCDLDFKNKAASFHSDPYVNQNQLSITSVGVDTAWVRHYASALAPSIDCVVAMSVDSFGNVYVTGYSSGLPFGVDYLTIKYDASGVQVWSARFDGGIHGDDMACAIRVDGLGNTYVTGKSVASNTGWDYATVKYNYAGVEQWVVRYNGHGNGSDEATALAIDTAGNVYVTGSCVNSGAGNDYATIKYNSDGVQQWVACYNGPTDSTDFARALAVDQSGNVYVTGESYGSGTDRDYATVKYNATGVQQWVARYPGPGKDWDRATALALDGVGNVYVTGSSGIDYGTVKYNSEGVRQWVVRYNGPGNSDDEANAIATDHSGNIYVTGWSVGSGTGDDYATVKYNSEGVQQWVARYNGPENDSDRASALSVDDSGNVYVTGMSLHRAGIYSALSSDYATVKYNPDGEEQWIARYNGPEDLGDMASAIALDAAGNVHVAGNSSVYSTWGIFIDSDYAIIKYNSAGVEQWVACYTGPGNSHDEANALAVDASGNVYVTGWSNFGYDDRGEATGGHYASVKYDSSGVEEWIARYEETGSQWATALAVDASGNVYVAGNYGDDYATVKYNSVGVQQWVARYDGPGNAEDRAVALAIDALGNVYVTGWSEDSDTRSDYATIKYNSEGIQQWIARYKGPGFSNEASDLAWALAVDDAGNVYVTGESDGSGTERDYATIKYNSEGVQQWVARYNGSGNWADYATALTVDGSGNVYVTGWSYGSGKGFDYATVKYNSASAEQWISRYAGPTDDDVAVALKVDDLGNVYVTGWSYGLGTSADYATVKYNSAGVEQWVARYNSPGNDWDETTALALDAFGNVYVTGFSNVRYRLGDLQSRNYATVKYDSSGVEQWVACYNGPRDSRNNAIALAVDASGNVYVTGTSKGDWWSVYTTIKYVQTPSVAVQKEELPKPGRYWLAQNYPNPFNPTTTIEFALPQSAFIRLKVYNLLGEEVATLIAEQQAAGIHKLNWDATGLASGVYLYRLEAGDFVDVQKLILLR